MQSTTFDPQKNSPRKKWSTIQGNFTKNQKIFKITFRPTDLPDAESLYDELQIVRKEIATQQKVIKTQRTKNVRLEAELKKRESQLADIFDGNERKRYFLEIC